LVFFFFSKDNEDHLVHLQLVLETLQNQQLFAKSMKCKFRCPKVEYLGHVISTMGVKADLAKIKGMIKWPFSKILKELPWSHGLL
jgi:hypothetical protein